MVRKDGGKGKYKDVRKNEGKGSGRRGGEDKGEGKRVKYFLMLSISINHPFPNTVTR